MTSHTLPRDSTAFDFIESLGGRDRYIERMREHGRRLAQLREAQRRRPSQLTTTRDVEGLGRTAPAHPPPRPPRPPRSGVDNQWAPGTSPQELSRRLSENRQRCDESLEAQVARWAPALAKVPLWGSQLLPSSLPSTASSVTQ